MNNKLKQRIKITLLVIGGILSMLLIAESLLNLSDRIKQHLNKPQQNTEQSGSGA